MEPFVMSLILAFIGGLSLYFIIQYAVKNGVKEALKELREEQASTKDGARKPTEEPGENENPAADSGPEQGGGSI